MNNTLININPDTQAVSMKEIYEFLEVRENWTDWTARMLDYGFTQNVDYQAVSVFVPHANGFGGTNKKDYALTLDTAKEICMIQRTEKGKQARQYFIECEKALKQPKELSRKDLALLVVAAEEEKERLQIELLSAVPKVEYFDEVLQSETVYDVNEIAKELGTSAITLNKRLNELGVQYKSHDIWLLYSKYQAKGYTKTTTEVRKYGQKTVTTMRTVWTEAGRKFIHTLFNGSISESQFHYQCLGNTNF